MKRNTEEDELRYGGKGKQFLPLLFPLIVRHESKYIFLSDDEGQ
jgi:hypothetical protein